MTDEFFLGGLFISTRRMGNKVDAKWHGPAIIIAMRGNMFSSVCYRWDTIETSLKDLRSENKVFVF